MENPFNNEQIKQLNEISSLPLEEQQEKLQSLLKTFSPEQVEYLQQQQCIFCSIVSGKIEGKKIYEDDSVMAVLDIKPANKGHVLVIPKDHTQFSTQLKDVGHFFTIVNKIVAKIFDTYQTGCNIHAANGAEAGQQVPHFVVHVIPRFKEDKINFTWEGKEFSEEELNKIKEELTLPVEEEIPVEEPVEEVKEEPKEEVETERLP